MFISINAILSITSLLGNILILIALHKDTSLHPPSKLSFRCLSCTDLLVELISRPMCIIYLASSIRKNQMLCWINEHLAKIFSGILCGESILILTAISVDRLHTLLLRLRYRQTVTLTRVCLLVIFSWMMSSVIAFFISFHERFFYVACCMWIRVCLAVSSFFYLKIYAALRRQQAEIQSHQQHSGATLKIAWYRKTVASAKWMYLTFIVCYLPYTVVTAINTSRREPLQCGLAAWNITGSLVFLNSTLNPFLYCWKMRVVRQAVKDTLRQQFCVSRSFVLSFYC